MDKPRLLFRNDLKLLSVLLLVVILFFLIRNLFSGGNGMRVTVSQDGVVKSEYALTDSRVFTVTSPSGGTNTVHIENGSVWITDASCPDKVCQNQGEISHEGEMLVCLPNRLTVSITE